MARSDLLLSLIEHGLNNNDKDFRRLVEAICAEERAKNHILLSEKINNLLDSSKHTSINNGYFANGLRKRQDFDELLYEKTPRITFADLLLEKNTITICDQLIEEQNRADLLRSYGIEPRNKVLLVGPPGNGKTSLAEAIANSLMVPFYIVRYESIIGSFLGETALKLNQLFDYVRTRQCVVFFDEFETLGKERGDHHETGEIKRVVSSLLLQIDSLPSYVILIAATNHEHLLDNAAWRRFQIKLKLPKPTRSNVELWFTRFQEKYDFCLGLQPSTLAKKFLGYSYSEIEDFTLSVYRQYILNQPCDDCKKITCEQIKLHKSQNISELPERGVIDDKRETSTSIP